MDYKKIFKKILFIFTLLFVSLTTIPAYSLDNTPEYNKHYFLNDKQEKQVESFNNFYHFLSIFNETKTYKTLNNIISYHIYAGDEKITHVISAGDSLNTGFDSTEDCFLKDCTFNSWSTGNHEDSILNQINRLNKETAQPIDLAQTGATVSMLKKQLNNAPQEGRASVNITIGSNDACIPNMTDNSLFRKQITEALDQYINRNPNSIIYMFSIPDIIGLYQLFKDTPAAQLTWDLTGFCSNVFSSDATNQTRWKVGEQVKQFNNILAEVCTQNFKENCRWDNYALYNHKFNKKEISTIDYFHPSIEGQKNLSKIAWEQGYTLF